MFLNKNKNKFKKYITIIATCTIVLTSFIFFNKKSEANSNVRNSTIDSLNEIAIWSWNPYEVTNTDKMIDFVQKYNVKTVLQYFDFNVFDHNEIYRYIKALKDVGVEVWALDGKPKWALTENHSTAVKWIETVGEYNTLHPDAKIIGVEADIEIYLIDGYNDNNQTLFAKQFQDLTYTFRATAQSYGLKVSYDIPTWFEWVDGHIDHGYYNLAKWVFEMADNVTLMAYDPENIDIICNKEMEYASLYNKSVRVGFETQEPGEYGVEESITYDTFGLDRMYEDFNYILTKYNTIYSNLNIQPTIHNYTSFNKLVSKDKPEWEAEFEIENAEQTKDLTDIDNARDKVNKLPESPKKDELQDRLDSIFPNLSLSLQSATSNLDIYIKSENMLSLSLDTNSIVFEEFGGTEDLEKTNAVTLTVNSSLPYDINSYLVSKIQNADKSETMNKSILNIKANSENTYNYFTDLVTPVKLFSNQLPGNDNIHSIDLILKGGIAHKSDVYKTTIKFEIVQK